MALRKQRLTITPIIKLREYRYATQTSANSGLKHVTVLEEAHNILKRCSHESSQDSANVQGASVEMLVNCIAEMRSCGEGMMIIDQSPSAVDEAALKNTAIKIVMRLPEKNDCEAIVWKILMWTLFLPVRLAIWVVRFAFHLAIHSDD